MLADAMFRCSNPQCGTLCDFRPARCCGECGELLFVSLVRIGKLVTALRSLEGFASDTTRRFKLEEVWKVWDVLKQATPEDWQTMTGSKDADWQNQHLHYLLGLCLAPRS